MKIYGLFAFFISHSFILFTQSTNNTCSVCLFFFELNCQDVAGKKEREKQSKRNEWRMEKFFPWFMSLFVENSELMIWVWFPPFCFYWLNFFLTNFFFTLDWWSLQLEMFFFHTKKKIVELNSGMNSNFASITFDNSLCHNRNGIMKWAPDKQNLNCFMSE